MALFTGECTILDYLKLNIPDGYHVFQTNALGDVVDIEVELINFYDDKLYTGNPILGDRTPDERMLILKYHGNLEISENVKMTPQTRKKGMFVYVGGTLTNRGTISMTARGANAEGQNIYLYQNKDGTFEYIPAVGGAGGASVEANSGRSSTTTKKGMPGEMSEIRRGTGGGGSGGSQSRDGGIAISGAGASGTSYSGGSGGGGIAANISSGTRSAEDAHPNGGKGGDGYSYRRNSSFAARSASGGAGNPGGEGMTTLSGNTSGSYHDDYRGEDGTGGLLILFARKINNRSIIEANGVQSTERGISGGSSGGGSVNIFYEQVENIGRVTVSGGEPTTHGGAGGEGSIVLYDTVEEASYRVLPNGLREVTKIEDLEIGCCIRCHYTATENKIGVFSNLGKVTSGLIPPESSATPDGDFYYIMVEDFNGKKILVADRVIQHSISWDSINEEGMTSTGREINF